MAMNSPMHPYVAQLGPRGQLKAGETSRSAAKRMNDSTTTHVHDWVILFEGPENGITEAQILSDSELAPYRIIKKGRATELFTPHVPVLRQIQRWCVEYGYPVSQQLIEQLEILDPVPIPPELPLVTPLHAPVQLLWWEQAQVSWDEYWKNELSRQQIHGYHRGLLPTDIQRGLSFCLSGAELKRGGGRLNSEFVYLSRGGEDFRVRIEHGRDENDKFHEYGP